MTRWVWDGDVPLHEWTELEVGPGAGQADSLATWLFEENSFAPAAKLTARGAYSVVADHLGASLTYIIPPLAPKASTCSVVRCLHRPICPPQSGNSHPLSMPAQFLAAVPSTEHVLTAGAPAYSDLVMGQ